MILQTQIVTRGSRLEVRVQARVLLTFVERTIEPNDSQDEKGADFSAPLNNELRLHTYCLPVAGGAGRPLF